MSLSQTAGGNRPNSGIGAGMDQVSSWSRDIRFASGMVLLVFATTHFLNHAVGIVGLHAMEEVQNWRYWLWHSWVGTVVLYAAMVVHPFFALLRVAQRRTFKMPVRELVQIALGLAIPLFLIDHIVGTRVMGSLFDLDESYHAVLRRLWPSLATTQSLLLLLVWAHGIIGLHFSLRSRDGYQRWRDPFLLAAILVPVLALIGFAVAGREAALMALPPENYSAASVDMFNQSVTWARMVFFGLVGCFVAFVGFREIRVRAAGTITVRFVGHGVRKLTPGLTVLEMFRRFGIPHAALCGGRARCATCRVLVLDGGDKLPPARPQRVQAAAPDFRAGPGPAGLPDQAARGCAGPDPAGLAAWWRGDARGRARRQCRQARPDRDGGGSARLLGPVRAAIAAGADRPAQPLLRRDGAGDHRPWRAHRRLLWRWLHGRVRARGQPGKGRAGGDQRRGRHRARRRGAEPRIWRGPAAAAQDRHRHPYRPGDHRRGRE